MSGLKLYEISQARVVLDTWLAESEGELTPELEVMLNELDGQADEKIERVALYVRERSAHAAAVKEERDRLAAIVKREEKAAESLKGYLKLQMERLGKTKVNGLLATIAIQSNPPSVTSTLTNEELHQMAHVCDFVVTVPASYRIDRDVVLARHKEGKPLPAGVVVERGSHIRIR